MSLFPRYPIARLRRLAFYAAAGLLVGAALLAGMASQLLPLVQRHPQQVAAWLSARAGQPVSFDRIATRWTRRGPLLQLDGLRIGRAPGLAIGQAEVLVSIYAGLLPDHALTELRLRGVSLQLVRADDGSWSVQGLPHSGEADPLDTLQRLGELQLVQARLQLSVPSLQWQARLPQVDLRLRVQGDRLRVGTRAWIDPAAAPLEGVLDLSRSRGDGQFYVQARPTDFAAWAPLWPASWPHPVQGQGRVQAWAQVRARQLQAVTLDADLRQLRLAGAPLAGTPVAAGLDRVQGRARWSRGDAGWRVDVPSLRVDAAGRRQQLDGLLLAGGRRWALAARTLDASPLLPLLALAGQVPDDTRRWLLQAHPQLRLADVEVAGLAGGPMRASGRLDALGFAAVGRAPGLSGLRGRFHGDAQALQFDPDAQATVRFDWPTGFGVVHELHLAGSIVGWRQGQGWQVATPALRVQAPDYGAEVRGGLWFQGDGTRPWIGLAAKIDDTAVTVARKFWIHSEMSRATIDWLDTALAGGTITGGTGLVVGDLDDWPFNDRNGRFEATGHIRDGRVRFQPDWPAMTGLEADVAFVGNGFRIAGNGGLAGVQVQRLEAGIDDFASSRLYVRAASDSDTAHLLEMLKQSPLHAEYADTLDNVSVSGPASTDFDLLLPLLEDGRGGHLRGRVALRGDHLADKRWDLAFDQVHGQVDYDDGGFSAPALAVIHKGEPGTLSLLAGGGVSDPANAFEARLTAAMAADELLDHAPELAWLKPYVHGTSAWTVGVTMPKAAAGGATAPSQLTLASDLAGTALEFPQPLAKPAGETLATQVRAALPLEAGRVDVAFGQRLALAARTEGKHTGVRVTLGSDRVAGEPPANGLDVDGHADALDALDWIGLARSPAASADTAASGEELPLNRVDVQVDRLLLIGGVFPDTRLQLRPQGAGLQVGLAGPSLAGTLSVPDAPGAAVSGTLDRVWWQAVNPPPAPPPGQDVIHTGSVLVEALPEQTRQSAEQADPAGIPPLALDVADLRFGKLQLGSAVLRTHPVSGGLQLQTLQMSAPRQSINVTGQWLGKDGGARTHLVTHIQTRDMGGFMQDLGYGGQLRGGEGTLDLDLAWPGGPTAFALASLQGQLHGEVRNGQLLEVDPGAGRVLGLLSIAQLPRRVMFDFRDFFSKGLAFNRVEGTLKFGDGLARTDRIAMIGPAADITLRGQADLRSETFDQTVDVNPKAGNLLTVVGAVAGGPVGAAVGAAANAVLSRPLGEIGARTYHVTGPWKDPQVEVIEREPRTGKRAAAPGSTPAD